MTYIYIERERYTFIDIYIYIYISYDTTDGVDRRADVAGWVWWAFYATEVYTPPPINVYSV